MSDRSRTANRTCEQCGGAMPHRQSRQRNEQGQLVCDSCKNNPAPSWNTTHSALSVVDQQEMRRREAEAITSIVKVRQAKHAGLSVVAHDSGDNAIINHCPFCGSGAVVGGSSGTVTCDFCHTPFTVQVAPAHPFLPQTIDGQPTPPPGMPGDAPTEMSAPTDPTVEEQGEDVAADPLGDADPAVPSNGPVRPGQPPRKQPPANQQPSKNRDSGGSKPPWLKDKKSSAAKYEKCPTCLIGWIVNGQCSRCGEDFPEKTASFRTAEGHTLDADAYMARLALSHADDRESVLDAVRVAHLQKETVQTRDPNSREEHPYPEMGDYVVIADAIRQFIRAGLFSTYAEASEALGDRLRVDGVQYNLTTRQRISEVMAEMGHTAKQAADSQVEFSITCPRCKGEGDTENGVRCDRCGGTGLVPGGKSSWSGPNRTAAMKPCPVCHGRGEVDTGRTEGDTGAPITVDCPRCHGLGELDDQDPANFDLREAPGR